MSVLPMTGHRRGLEVIEEKSALLFLVAGGLLIVFAALLGVEAVTDRAAPEDIFGPGGFAIAFVGLLGLYPTLADKTPWLARVGALFAAVGSVGAAGTSLGSLGSFMGVLPEDPPAWAAIFMLAMVIGMVPGFISFGVASLRTDIQSRTTGFLLLIPAIIFAVMFSGTVHSVVNDSLANLILSSGQALSHLAIGLTLRSQGLATDRPEPAADATA